MSVASPVGIVPYCRRDHELHPGPVVVCHSEDAAGRLGRRMMERFAGLVFYRITDSDNWQVIAVVGEAPVSEED